MFCDCHRFNAKPGAAEHKILDFSGLLKKTLKYHWVKILYYF